jgi:hypothetical protein
MLYVMAVDVYVGSIDEYLNDQFLIVPGCGDAGDRLFSTTEYACNRDPIRPPHYRSSSPLACCPLPLPGLSKAPRQS